MKENQIYFGTICKFSCCSNVFFLLLFSYRIMKLYMKQMKLLLTGSKNTMSLIAISEASNHFYNIW